MRVLRDNADAEIMPWPLRKALSYHLVFFSIKKENFSTLWYRGQGRINR